MRNKGRRDVVAAFRLVLGADAATMARQRVGAAFRLVLKSKKISLVEVLGSIQDIISSYFQLKDETSGGFGFGVRSSPSHYNSS